MAQELADTSDGCKGAVCRFPFIAPGSHPDHTIRLAHPLDERFRANNFDLCRAIDTTKLAVVLQSMVDDGWLDKRDAELFDLQASTLRAQLCTANNKAFSGKLALPID